MWILAASCAFIAGIGFAASQDPRWLLALCPALTFALMLTRITRTTVTIFIVIMALGATLGVVRHAEPWSNNAGPSISDYNDSGRLEIEATIAEEPEYGARFTRLLLDNLCLRDGAGLIPLTGRMLLTSSDPRQVQYGQRVLFRGTPAKPQPFDGFDYPGYLALGGILSTAFCTELEPLDEQNRRPAMSGLLALNSALAAALARTLPEPESSLAQSLLLGRRASLPDTVQEAFVRTGTAHLLAISGLHLGIVVAAAVALLLAMLGRRHYLYVWLGLAALWTYALFTGMRPPVVRAAIMASTFLAAELAGRQKHAPTALALAAAVMVGIEPQLLWRTSFQLSVLAMGALVLLFPPLRWLLHTTMTALQSRLGVTLHGIEATTDIVAATVAATIAVWPTCAATFGQASLVGVPVSLLTLPALPFALASASAAAVAALASAMLAAPFAWVSWLFLTFMLRTVATFSSLPWASLEASPPAQWQTALYYAVLCTVPLLWQRLRRPAVVPRTTTEQSSSRTTRLSLRVLVPALILGATLAWSAFLSSADGRLHVVFLDVGQGDSILIQTPTGRTILVDGGPDGQRTCALVDSHRPFWDRSIDVVVATHAHADHLAGLLTAAARYNVSLVLEPPIAAESILCDEWRSRVAATGCNISTATAGRTIETEDGVRLEILHPPVTPLIGTSDDIDNNGVVLRLTYGDVSFLLTADIRAEAEQYLLHRMGSRLESHVLKVPHHGSNTSSTGPFVAAVRPSMTVLSLAEDNPYGHPHADVVSRLESIDALVLTTGDCGSIELVTDGTSLWVTTERDTIRAL